MLLFRGLGTELGALSMITFLDAAKKEDARGPARFR